MMVVHFTAIDRPQLQCTREEERLVQGRHANGDHITRRQEQDTITADGAANQNCYPNRHHGRLVMNAHRL